MLADIFRRQNVKSSVYVAVSLSHDKKMKKHRGYGAPNQSIFPPYFCDPVYSLYGQLDFFYDQLFTS